MSTTEPRSTGPIVVGVDGRPGTHLVLEWAAREAQLRHAPLTLVHAAGSSLDLGNGRAGTDVGCALARAAADARRVLDEAAAVVAATCPDVTVVRHVSLDGAASALRRGDPSPALVVVGTRSGDRSASTLDGLEGLLDDELTCPVVEVGDAGAAVRMLVLTDGTTWSVPVLAAAFEEAALRHLAVTVGFVLADPGPGDPAQDLRLMDQTARIEAASGPSSLGFQRTLLGVQVQVMQDRFPAVPVRVVDVDEEVDRLLAATAATTTYVIADSWHLRRLHELAAPAAAGHWITVVVPTDRPDSLPEVPDLHPEVQRFPERDVDLEAWWDAPTVDQPHLRARVPVRVPVRARVRHPFRRQVEP